MLLQAGAKVNVRTSHQVTQLLLAAAARKRTLGERLLRAAARQDEITGHFLEMLEFAARVKEPEFQKVPDGAPRMLRFLQSLAEDQKFVLHGCSHATLMLLFPGRIRDPLALAERLFRLRSDERA